MGFSEDMKALAERVTQIGDKISTEEATKMSMVIPFFQLLGYDVFNPSEFCPEYVSDVGIKKGEKVDYAILIDGSPEILIECKWCGESLDKHGSQLFRYFGTSPAKFGILTNGITYRFYTDLDEANKMDLIPFMEIDMKDLKDNLITELNKFRKESFDKDNIFSTASELKYLTSIKKFFSNMMEAPGDEFVRYVLSETYDGVKTQKTLEKFRPIIKKAFVGFINEIVNQKISAALTPEVAATQTDTETVPAEEIHPQSKIITTEEELESYYIVRGILAGILPVEDIAYRDTESYFGILYKNNNRKPICRIDVNKKVKQLLIPDENKNFERIYIHSMTDIYEYKDKIIASASKYLEKA